MAQENDGPVLSIPGNVPVYYNGQVSVPILFEANETDISAASFSIDFDENCLTFDVTDSNNDGIPDAIAFHTPGAFNVSVDDDLNFIIADTSPPLSSLPDGRLATITFTAICQPDDNSSRIAAVSFSNAPPPSFGDTGGQSVAGTALNGSVSIRAGLAGDCNGDGLVDAGDIPALVLDIFQNAFGNVGCDANQDTAVDAGDLSCLALLIFHGPGACSNGSPAGASALSESAGAPELSIPEGIEAKPNETVTVPISFTSHGHSINSVFFSLNYDQQWLSFDPTDSDGDGIPDAVTFENLPSGFDVSVLFDADNSEEELKFVIADFFPPLVTLPDEIIASITFITGETEEDVETAVRFSQKSAASFGNTSGQSVPGNTNDGSVLISSQAGETGESEYKVFLPFAIKP